MKILICLLIVSLSWQISIAQNVLSDTAKYELWKKSKTQRTIGIVLLSAGAVTTVIGASIAGNHVFVDPFDGKEQVTGTGAVMAGIVMMAGSIPFFIMAGKNHKASLAVINVQQLQMNTGLVTTRSTPQLSLTLTRQIF